MAGKQVIMQLDAWDMGGIETPNGGRETWESLKRRAQPPEKKPVVTAGLGLSSGSKGGGVLTFFPTSALPPQYCTTFCLR